jgi:uncharacterized repeat protein (TIGR01451 family)
MTTRVPPSARRWAPRLLILGALAALVTALIGAPGGASAAPGPTDLSLTKNDSADPVVRGSNFSYTIQVRNLGAGGTADAENVTVLDPLPSQVDFVSANASSGTCSQAAGTVTCNLGTLLAGASASVTITVQADRAGNATNVATVSTTTPGEMNTGNNQDSETTTIQNKPGKGKGKKAKASCAAPTISGTAGNDTLIGTNRADVIRAFAGDDQVFAGDGKDLICADLGADFVSGGPKSDTAIGGGGPDRLVGKAGGDTLKGKKGQDRLRGNVGSDFLNGGRGRDSCKGGPGQDTLRRCP